ncbi:ABC transporter permease [Rhodococcus sp. BP-252]|uniref:ABC transporter permease n=1 Tax=unclassified Rhodococcus (in: high G+C Gram-positive bacteria) TaxID=192944 RepID=UPI00142F6BE4|nr:MULTISPECIES: ABC transporter permease [unclassified Rhodococcus (in: high G+C Gram-positive bacteria)]MBY6411502.1 ABC transporter permease [Rhodococcus sp. BP-320]MBY6416161.1 ABC transporter permease [Rhodococcus sp. BP-321]MBY6423515.1 ABC transporter permease [Rhodococcus sp. BP-324]MBY6426368.1 ABC transporter permease [Rhodococcus sp. BP-323]MBY6431091.1 ABC transporter permease [Rhodococcus sp. BP-322]
MTTLASRKTLPLGGFSLTFLGLEITRLIRNRRTVVFTLVMPPVFFVIFGTQSDYTSNYAFANGNVTAFVAISMAVYGAMLAATSGGAMVSVERAQGWSRQLRLTPLRPVAYIVTKMLIAMTMGLASVVVVFAVAAAFGADMPLWVWLSTGVIAWLGSSVFAAFGLFMGYLLPSENVMQVLGPVLAVLAFAGGLFVPLADNGWFPILARFTPLYGLATVARAPFTEPSSGTLAIAAVNLVVWAAVFVVGAAMLFRRDTRRV